MSGRCAGGRTFITSTNGLPSGSFWKRVSSKRMAPETYWLMPGVVKSRLRHFWRFASEFSMPLACHTQPLGEGTAGVTHTEKTAKESRQWDAAVDGGV